MPVYCTKTAMGEFYGITDNPIVSDLHHFIEGINCSSEEDYSRIAHKILDEFDGFVKDVRRVAVEDTKVKKKIASYDDCEIAYNILSDVTEKNIDDYYRNAMIAILKVLENVKKKDLNNITNEKIINRERFIGIASFLHHLLFQICEFTEGVASYKEKKDYNRSHSRKSLMAIEIMGMARQLPRHQICYNDISQNMESVFLIRQAIEVRTQELLQIRGFRHRSNGQEIKVAPDALITLLDNELVKLPGKITPQIIKGIHAWTNIFVHTGQSYYQWETEFYWEIISEYIFDTVDIKEEFIIKIPELALSVVRDIFRDDAEVVMSSKYCY